MIIHDLEDGVYFIHQGTKIIHIKGDVGYDFSGELRNGDYKEFPYIEQQIKVSDDPPKWGTWKRKKSSIDEYIQENNIDFPFKECWLARAYEVGGGFLLEKEPIKLNWTGSGFNYGSCNIVEVTEPGFILILAEND